MAGAGAGKSWGPGGQTPAAAVRFASLADIEVVAQGNSIANAGGLALVRRLLERGQVVVAERDGEPVGDASFDSLGVLDPFLAFIGVAEGHRRRGIGRTILRFLEQHFQTSGHTVLYRSARADAADAQAWHRPTGFEACGFITGLGSGRVGEVFFRKRLNGGAR